MVDHGFEFPSLDELHAIRQVDAEDYFGVCPECGNSDGQVFVGKSHWGHCREHRTRWDSGYNIISDDRTEEEQRAAYEALDFGSYREVEDVPFDPERHPIDIPAALARRREDEQQERQQLAELPEGAEDIPF